MTFNQFKFYIQANWLKTIYLNFKVLPFRDAVKMPILLFGKCYLQISKSARAEFLGGEVAFASVFIGNSSSSVWGTNIRQQPTTVLWDGLITFSGRKQFIGNGCVLSVCKEAHLHLGDHVLLNNNVKLCCQHDVFIDDLSGFSWECQIFDTNFHYIVEDGGRVGRKSGSIHIGKNCWIGYRSTIQKGTYLEDNSTLASNSLINKNYAGVKDGLFTGIPAKLHATGRVRSKNYALEYKLDEFFETHPKVNFVSIDVEASRKFYDFSNLEIKVVE